jgi:hypothetical protein
MQIDIETPRLTQARGFLLSCQPASVAKRPLLGSEVRPPSLLAYTVIEFDRTSRNGFVIEPLDKPQQ